MVHPCGRLHKNPRRTGKDHSELLWMVDDARQFNVHGATPTNLTTHDVLRVKDENDWHTAEDIRLLTRLAALFHDFSKANDAFQKKLTSKKPVADAYRHEWVSLGCLKPLSGKVVIRRLTGLAADASTACLDQLQQLCDGAGNQHIDSPFKKLPPLAQVVGWLIVSHHRLPTPPQDTVLNKRLLEKLLEQIDHR